MKVKRVTIVNPLYLVILNILKKEKFKGICANIFCQDAFTFKWSFIKKKLIPHIKECRKRKEKRGSYPWIFHYCDVCGRKFEWDLFIHVRMNGDEIQYHYKLKTQKHLGNWKNRK